MAKSEVGSLTVAYLDLGVAFCSLLVSSAVFLTMKFLEFCGLLLHYPCNGLFGIFPNDVWNFQWNLLDFASKKISDATEHMNNKKLDENVCFSDDDYYSDNGSEEGSEEQRKMKELEKAVEEEKVARAALSEELEKDRSAAATAAEEAMAMILRLQEEKATVEMESRQFQRIIEEKSAFVAEEINTLRELLVRVEAEKQILVDEIEAFRQKKAATGGGNRESDNVPWLQDDDEDYLFEEIKFALNA